MGGWQRVGIVASVVWVLAAPVYFWHAYDTEARSAARAYYESCTGPFRDVSGHLSIDPGKCLAGSHKLEREYRSRPGYGWSSWVLGAAVYLALGWLIGWGMVAIGRWVARGFT